MWRERCDALLSVFGHLFGINASCATGLQQLLGVDHCSSPSSSDVMMSMIRVAMGMRMRTRAAAGCAVAVAVRQREASTRVVSVPRAGRDGNTGRS